MSHAAIPQPMKESAQNMPSEKNYTEINSATIDRWVAVLDYSESQLASERLVAEREGYDINIIKADMTNPLPFADASFDLIFHPVSNCYIEDVQHVWNECYRILKPGGVLLAGMDNGVNFLFSEWDEDEDDTRALVVDTKLPFNPLRNPAHYQRYASDAEEAIFQFSHTMEEQIGGQLQAGFQLCSLYEDHDNAGRLRHYIPTYVATHAVKPV